MSGTIYLVRHAQTDFNARGFFMGRSDIGLNRTGVLQAKQIALRLSDLPISSAYTSPLKRTSDTASVIARVHGLTPRAVPELVEVNYGDWEGLSREEVSSKWHDLLLQWKSEPSQLVLPNGESFKELKERSVRALKEIIAAEKDNDVVIVSHSGPLKVMLMHILSASEETWSRFEVNNASLSVVKINAGVPQLSTLNDVSHLIPGNGYFLEDTNVLPIQPVTATD